MRYSERLIILADLAEGLMQRTTGIRNKLAAIITKPKCIEDESLAKIKKTLDKAFPEMPPLEKIPGFDRFQFEAPRIMEELKYIYDHMIDLVQWKDEALRVLLEAVNDIIEFKFDRNPLLIRGVMKLLVAYIKLMLYWTRIPDHRVLLSLYVRACTVVNEGRPGPNLLPVGQFCVKYAEPLQVMVDEFSPISMQVGHLLASLRPWMTQILSPTTLRQQNTFNPLAEADRVALPAYKKVYTDLLYGDQFVEWVLYGFLVCPTQLLDPAGMAVFKLAAEQGFMLHVYDDMVLTYHDHVETLLQWWPLKGAPKQFDRDIKRPKLAMALCKQAVKNSGRQHQQMREYLRDRCFALVRLLHEFPGLIAPKLPMILAAVSCARAELSWYIVHQNQSPPKKRLKHLQPSEYFFDRRVSGLLYAHDQLVQIIRSSSDVIKEYYCEYLQGAHVKALKELVDDALAKHNGKLTQKMQQVLIGFLEQLSEVHAASVQDGDLLPLRLNWARLSEVLTSGQFNAASAPGMALIMDRMNTIVQHTRFVDDLEGLIVEFCELQRVFSFGAVMDSMFNQVLTGGEQCRYASSFLRLASHGLNNLHPMCPDQRDAVGEECTRRAASYLTRICNRIADGIQPMAGQLDSLSAACGPMEAAFRLQRSQASKRAGREPAAEPLPGFESTPWGSSSIMAMVVPDHSVGNLCWGMGRCGDVFVYETCFSPVEWIREKLFNTFKGFVRDLVRGGSTGNSHVDGGGDSGMQPPSVLLRSVQNYCIALQRATQHINVDVNKLVRGVLYGETYSKEVSQVGTLTPASECKMLGDTFLKHVCNWYMLLCDNLSPLGSVPPGVVYSPFTRGLVAVQGVAPSSALPAEFFADEVEIEALAELLGPAGMRVMESAILLRVKARAHHIKTYLHKHASLLAEVRDQLRARNPHAWAAEANKLRGASDELVQHLIGVGILLSFRQQLKKALARIGEKRAPCLSALITSALSCWEENSSSSPALMPLDHLASDVGRTLPAADQNLKAALSPLKSSTEDAGIWDILPIAVAVSFHDSSLWRRTVHCEAVDACASNEHLIMPAAESLIYIFQSFKVQTRATPTSKGTEEQLNVQTALHQMVTVSATVLLRMKARQHESGFKDLPLRAMLVLVEKFVNSCPYVNAGVMHAIIPYEMMHAAYVDMGLGRFRSAEAGQTVRGAIATAGRSASVEADDKE